MEVMARLKRARISAQKMRLVADQIRGRPVSDALNLLTFSTNKGAAMMRKVLESAIANAENNQGADVDDLSVARVQVDEGVTMKRLSPQSRGRAHRIFKRTCHVTLAVAD